MPILDFWGPYAKLCYQRGGGGGERMDETHLSVFHSILNRANGKHSRNRFSSLFHGSGVLCFIFLSHARDCTTFTLHDLTDFYIERVTVHCIKIIDHSCFHYQWPTSKNETKWKALWEEGGLWCFGALRNLRILRIECIISEPYNRTQHWCQTSFITWIKIIII